MADRKNISASMRWHIFARDGFTCRYCGVRAGQEGVELAVDHVVSVKDGGDNHPDNLVTACRTCNGGKAARSLSAAPTSAEVVARVQAMAANLQEQAAAIQTAIKAQADVEQEIVNLKCAAYGTKQTQIVKGEAAAVRKLVREFGADVVLEFYQSACQHGVSEWNAVKYVCGCARTRRERNANA